MQKPHECCNFNCEQGDLCPIRQRKAAPPDAWDWIIFGAIAVIGILMSLAE